MKLVIFHPLRALLKTHKAKQNKTKSTCSFKILLLTAYTQNTCASANLQLNVPAHKDQKSRPENQEQALGNFPRLAQHLETRQLTFFPATTQAGGGWGRSWKGRPCGEEI